MEGNTKYGMGENNMSGMGMGVTNIKQDIWKLENNSFHKNSVMSGTNQPCSRLWRKSQRNECMYN